MATPTMNVPQHQLFIGNLEVPEIPTHIRSSVFRGPTVRDQEKGAFVDAGSLVSFVAGISGQTQNDILNSTMLAQLAADKKFDREQRTEDWYKFYKSVLEHMGWVVQDFAFTKYEASGKDLEVDKAVLSILAAVATQNELAVVQAAIDAAKSLADGDGRITLFDHFCASRTTGCFQIGVASETNGAIALKLGSFQIRSSNQVTKILWFKFSTQNTQIYQGTQAATLNASLYSQFRTIVEQKLGERAKLFLGGLDV